MSRKWIGTLLLLAVSVIAGILQGLWFYNLFVRTMPPLALSSFNQGAAQFMFVLYGIGSGVAIFVLALLAILVSPAFRARSSTGAPAASVRL